MAGSAAEREATKEILVDHAQGLDPDITLIDDSNPYGRILILPSRVENLSAIQGLVNPDLICVQLPAEAPQQRTRAVWTLAAEYGVGPDTTRLRLIVDDADRGCGHDPRGRILAPVVDYRSAELEVIVWLSPVDDGPHTCEAWSPEGIWVDLREPVGSRAIVGGGA